MKSNFSTQNCIDLQQIIPHTMKKVFLCFMIAYACQSCIFLAAPIAKDQANKQLTVENNGIPTDIGMDGTYVIGLLEERESRDKYLRKHLDANYKGDYVYSTMAELETKYADVTKYRYVLTYTKLSGGVYHISDQTTTPTSSSNYFIYDRKENKEYNTKFHSSMFGKVIEAYAKNMEKQRVVNLNRK